MSLFEKIFGPKEPAQARQPATVFRLLSSYRPVFRSWGGELYEDELIRDSLIRER